MKYMLMMNVPRGTGDYQIGNWSPDDFKAHMTFPGGKPLNMPIEVPEVMSGLPKD